MLRPGRSRATSYSSVDRRRRRRAPRPGARSSTPRAPVGRSTRNGGDAARGPLGDANIPGILLNVKNLVDDTAGTLGWSTRRSTRRSSLAASSPPTSTATLARARRATRGKYGAYWMLANAAGMRSAGQGEEGSGAPRTTRRRPSSSGRSASPSASTACSSTSCRRARVGCGGASYQRVHASAGTAANIDAKMLALSRLPRATSRSSEQEPWRRGRRRPTSSERRAPIAARGRKAVPDAELRAPSPAAAPTSHCG